MDKKLLYKVLTLLNKEIKDKKFKFKLSYCKIESVSSILPLYINE